MSIHNVIRVESTIYTKLISVCFTVNSCYYRCTRSCTMPHRGLNYSRVMIILILLLLLTNLHLKLLSTQGTGTDYANVQINPPSLVETSTLPGQPFPPVKDLHIT